MAGQQALQAALDAVHELVVCARASSSPWPAGRPRVPAEDQARTARTLRGDGTDITTIAVILSTFTDRKCTWRTFKIRCRTPHALMESGLPQPASASEAVAMGTGVRGGLTPTFADARSGCLEDDRSTGPASVLLTGTTGRAE